jgi:hypothetical protein
MGQGLVCFHGISSRAGTDSLSRRNRTLSQPRAELHACQALVVVPSIQPCSKLFHQGFLLFSVWAGGLPLATVAMHDAHFRCMHRLLGTAWTTDPPALNSIMSSCFMLGAKCFACSENVTEFAMLQFHLLTAHRSSAHVSRKCAATGCRNDATMFEPCGTGEPVATSVTNHSYAQSQFYKLALLSEHLLHSMFLLDCIS